MSRIQPSILPRIYQNLRISPSAAYAHWTGWRSVGKPAHDRLRRNSRIDERLRIPTKTRIQQRDPALPLHPRNLPVCWDISAEEFFEEMQKKHQKFWNRGSLDKATAIGMTLTEVCTLASIVRKRQTTLPKNQWWQGSTSTAAPLCYRSRPTHQICLAGLRLAENYECPSGSKVTLQHLSQHQFLRSHTHPSCIGLDLYWAHTETQLPHVCPERTSRAPITLHPIMPST